MILISIICTRASVPAPAHRNTDTNTNIIKWRRMEGKELKSRVVQNYYSLAYIFALLFNPNYVYNTYIQFYIRVKSTLFSSDHSPTWKSAIANFLNCKFFIRLHIEIETERHKEPHAHTMIIQEAKLCVCVCVSVLNLSVCVYSSGLCIFYVNGKMKENPKPKSKVKENTKAICKS